MEAYPGLVAPRKATPRNFDRQTIGQRTRAVASLRGRPLIPWQQYAADLMGEVDDEGILYYSTIVLTVPRQAGKTDLDLSESLATCLSGHDRRTWYTAQSGQHASDHFIALANEWETWPETNALRRLTRGEPRRSNGSQALSFINGSTFRPHPPTENSLHGKQADRSTVDEGWSFSQVQGTQLLQAIAPTMNTRRMLIGQRPQLIIQSTEGTIESEWLNAIIDEQRDRDLTDGGRTAFLDWGIPDDADPFDLDVLKKHHPGYGYLLDDDTLHDMAARFKESPGEFARAYGNRRTGSTERVIPAEPWRAAATQDFLPEGRIAIGAAHGVDGADTTISAAIRQGDRIITEIIQHEPGTTWALPRLIELAGKSELQIGGFAIDRYGPSAPLADAAERAGLPLIAMSTSAVSASAANIYAWITQPDPVTGAHWRYRPHAALDLAADLATRRFVQDGAWTWGRRKSIGSISALESVTNATWGADHLPEEIGIQIF